ALADNAHVYDLGPEALGGAGVGVEHLVGLGVELDLHAVTLGHRRGDAVAQVSRQLERVRIGRVIGVHGDEHVAVRVPDELDGPGDDAGAHAATGVPAGPPAIPRRDRHSATVS